jgi:hypothetical protein
MPTPMDGGRDPTNGTAGTAGGRRPDAPGVRTGPCAGASLIIVLLIVLLLSLLGFCLLFTTDLALKTGRNHGSASTAAALAESGVNEVIYRLNMKDIDAPAPNGCRITVNHLVDFDARILPDPDRLLFNNIDDDQDGLVDEPDELNLARDWEVRILLTEDDPAPGPPYEYRDPSVETGPPWGNRYVLPTIQPKATWLAYTTATIDGTELLVRFKKESDLGAGDPEGDGDEIVFYNPMLAKNGVDDINTLSAPGGNGDPADDSPYNIDWKKEGVTVPASGSPVIQVSCTGRVTNPSRILGLLDLRRTTCTRTLNVEIAQEVGPVAARALCGCSDLDLGGSARTDSYRSSEGDYGTGPVYQRGGVGSNGGAEIREATRIGGPAQTGENLTVEGNACRITGNVIAGGIVAGARDRIEGNISEHHAAAPAPCFCDFDVGGLVGKYASMRKNPDDIRGIEPGPSPYRCGTCAIERDKRIYTSGYQLKLDGNSTIILTGGKYYFDSIEVTGNASIQVGVDSDHDCVVDLPPTRRVEIFVRGGVKLEGKGIVNTSRPANLVVYSAASPPDTVQIAGGSDFRGVIVAPRARVEIAGASTLEGAALGDTVIVRGDARVHYDEDLEFELQLPGYRIPIAWNEPG